MPPPPPEPLVSLPDLSASSEIDNFDWRSIPATVPQALVQRPADQQIARQARARNQKVTCYGEFPPRRQEFGDRSGTNKVAKIVGSIVGVGVLLFVGLIVLGAVLTSLPESKSTITAGGFAVDGRGKFDEQRSHFSDVADGISEVGQRLLHRRTNSEYRIAIAKPVVPHSIDMGQVYRVLQASGAGLGDVQAVTRAGLQGHRMKLTRRGGGITECEVFPITGNQLLLVEYFTGQAKQAAGVGQTKLTPEQTQRLDDPDAFFASLRRHHPR